MLQIQRAVQIDRGDNVPETSNQRMDGQNTIRDWAGCSNEQSTIRNQIKLDSGGGGIYRKEAEEAIKRPDKINNHWYVVRFSAGSTQF
jgi:hypothetical protein